MKKLVIYETSERKFECEVMTPKTKDAEKQACEEIGRHLGRVCHVQSVPAGLKKYPDFVIKRAFLTTFSAGHATAKDEKPVAAEPAAPTPDTTGTPSST